MKCSGTVRFHCPALKNLLNAGRMSDRSPGGQSFPATLHSRNNIPAILMMTSAEDRPSNELAEPLKD